MNNKSHLVLLVVILCIASGMYYRSQIIALISLPFIFYFAVGYIFSPTQNKLIVQRKIKSQKTFEDQDNSMDILITNQGEEIPFIEVIDHVPDGVQTISGTTSHYGFLGRNDKLEFSYEFNAGRGKYLLNQLTVHCSDPFKLFSHQKIINTNDVLISFPKPVLLPHIKLKPHFTLHSPGVNLSKKPGIGLNFWGIREYQSGDPINRIIWKMSGKFPGKTYLKEFEDEKMVDIGILIDTREKKPLFFNNRRVAEYSINAGLSLSKNLLSDFNRLSVFLLGKNRKRVFSGVGKYQLNRIQNEIANFDIEGNSSYESINQIPLKIFPNRSIVFMISPLQENDDRLIHRLVSEGHQIILISPNVFTNRIVNEPFTINHSLGFRMGRIERIIMLHNIQKIGVMVYDWDLNLSIRDLINNFRKDMLWR